MSEPQLIGFEEPEWPDDYVFTRSPRPEQLRGFMKSRDAEYYALFYDPRVGKTKVIDDTFVYNYLRGRVTAMVVIAYPSSVHLVWGDEIPQDFPPDLLARTHLLVWRRGKMASRAGKAAIEAALAHDTGPVIVTMNCEAILTATAYNFLRRLFARHRVLLVVDEDWAVNWSARTQRLMAMGRSPRVVMRRLLTGTPADEGPADLYYPCTFLKPGSLGFTSMAAFKARYFEYEEERGYNRRTNTYYDVVRGYQNLDELRAKLARFSDRAVRRGSTKVYATRYFEMTPRQAAVYARLRDEYVVEIASGETSVTNVLTRMTRLQQVARNYLPPTRTADPCQACFAGGYTEEGEVCPECEGLGYCVEETEFERVDPERNPAAEVLADVLRESVLPFVVWCRFRQDVDDALAAAREVRGAERVARYDGTVAAAERRAAYDDFRAGRLDGVVATERSSLSRGHEMSRARLMVYYSQEWSLRDRTQSEERASTSREEDWCDIVDIIAADTRDLDQVTALREKRSVAALITASGLRAAI